MDHSLTIEEKNHLRKVFKNSETAIKSLIKQFKYNESLTHRENMQKLYACIHNVMDVDTMDDFCRYISDIDQFPIEVNAKYEYS